MARTVITISWTQETSIDKQRRETPTKATAQQQQATSMISHLVGLWRLSPPPSLLSFTAIHLFLSPLLGSLPSFLEPFTPSLFFFFCSFSCSFVVSLLNPFLVFKIGCHALSMGSCHYVLIIFRSFPLSFILQEQLSNEKKGQG